MQFPRSWRALLILSVALVSPPALNADARQTLFGHVPAEARPDREAGRLSAQVTLDLTLGLPLRNGPALTTLLRELYRPASQNFHRFLTPDEFAARFAPTAADYDVVRAFAEASGFHVTRQHSNRTLLTVRASVAQVEKAFHLELHLYHHPTQNRLFYAPDRDPSYDSPVTLLSVDGLDDFAPPHPASLNSSPASPLSTGSGPAGTFVGGDLRNAYAPGTALTGAGQSIGLLELASYYPADVSSYASTAGLSNINVTNIILDDLTNSPGPNNVEVALDIEAALAMAPGAEIFVYEGHSAEDILNQMATDNAAAQLSSSWTFSPINASTEQIYEQFAIQGQAMFQASGDSGALSGPIPSPSDSPWVTSVGGTELTTDTNGGWESESVWNWNTTGQGDHASSGGSSTLWSIPIWQAGIDMSANQGSAAARNIPDVAIVADHIYAVASNGVQFSIGGTSAAAPLWTAYYSLANQQAAMQGQGRIGFADPPIYSLARATGYDSLFHDVVLGNNTNLDTATNYFAVPGYDLCTGWGSPNGTNLIAALAGAAGLGLTVINGGFESASFWGWTVDATGIVTVVGKGNGAFPSAYAPYVHSGTYGAYLAQSGSLGYLSQNLTTIPGQTYLVSCWLANPVGGSPTEFSVSFESETLFDQTNLPTVAWTNLQFTVIADQTNTLLEFGFRQDVDAFGLDDVEVMPIPTPSFVGIIPDGAGVDLEWNAWTGVQYQIEYTTNLGCAVWNSLGPPFIATNDCMVYSDLAPTDAQRFYRVAVAP